MLRRGVGDEIISNREERCSIWNFISCLFHLSFWVSLFYFLVFRILAWSLVLSRKNTTTKWQNEKSYWLLIISHTWLAGILMPYIARSYRKVTSWVAYIHKIIYISLKHRVRTSIWDNNELKSCYHRWLINNISDNGRKGISQYTICVDFLLSVSLFSCSLLCCMKALLVFKKKKKLCVFPPFTVFNQPNAVCLFLSILFSLIKQEQDA